MTLVIRYALHLVDTVIIGSDKTSCLTSGVKSVKDTMFFLNQDGDAEVPKPSKKAPNTKSGTNGNVSPAKNKTAGGKVLRNKTRSAAQEELLQSTAAKIGEHQRELHQKLQSEGLARFSEGGGGLAGKEGKTWKRFTSYKGEAALPKEIENMRVWILGLLLRICTDINDRSLSIEKHRPSSSLYMDSRYRSTLTPSRTLAKTMRENSLSCGSTSRLLDNWQARKRIRSVAIMCSSNNIDSNFLSRSRILMLLSFVP
jgi:hypothetical protein